MKKYFSLIVFLIFMFSNFSVQSASGDTVTKTPIKHVINIFFENNAFDTIFGIYPYDKYSWNPSIIKNMSVPDNLLGKNILKSLSPVPAGEYSVKNPVEGYTAYNLDWNNGKMNNFANGSGPQSMVYFTSDQFGLEWSLASEYSIGDRYFSNFMSESAPNTLYYYAGFSPVINDYGPPPQIPFNETIFGELSNYGISWGIYVGDRANGTFDYSSYLSGWENHLDHLHSWEDFISQTNSGGLPSVTYLFTQDFGDYDQHPPNNVERGEIWLAYIVNEIEKSPVWNSSIIFITYDEFGGFYDHVPPPKLDGVQLGMRIPLIVISPYAKEDYISHTVMTHTSILAFIDYNWNIPALNSFVANSCIPIDMLNFNRTYRDGSIARPPINVFSTIPGINASLYPVNINLNFSHSFPINPQYSYSDLPYSREGSTNLTLSSMGAGIFVYRNTVLFPVYFEPWFFIILFIANVAIIAFWSGKNGR